MLDITPRSGQIFVVKKQKVQSGSHARQQRPQLTPGVGWTGRWGSRGRCNRGTSDFDQAFHSASQRSADAVLLLGSPLFYAMMPKIAQLSIGHRLPAFYFVAEFARVGGLMAYGPNIRDSFRQVGVMTGKVLQGIKPADLPIERPTKFNLLINLKTAKALGLTIPDKLLALADEVIE